MIIGIVAVGKNNEIACKGKVPWHEPDDLKWFKKATYGNIVVMGRKTFETIGENGLEKRLNIVLTSKLKKSGRIIFFQNKESILNLKHYVNKSIFIIGGKCTFTTFLDDIDEWLVSRIPISINDADTYMPDDYLNGFEKHFEYKINQKLVCEHYIKNE